MAMVKRLIILESLFLGLWLHHYNKMENPLPADSKDATELKPAVDDYHQPNNLNETAINVKSGCCGFS